MTKEHMPGAMSKENTLETIKYSKRGWQNHWAPGFSCPLTTEQALSWSSLRYSARGYMVGTGPKMAALTTSRTAEEDC